MDIKLLNKIEENSPVTNPTQRVISCADFTGELSSKTGIIAKSIYIAKIIEQEKIVNGIKEQEVKTEFPDIIITCSPECEVPCKNLFGKRIVEINKIVEIVRPQTAENIVPLQNTTPDNLKPKSKYF